MHRTTHERPIDRRTQEPLAPLPQAFAWERFATEERRVGWDGYLSYDGVLYGLPSAPPLAGSVVQVRERHGVLTIWSAGQLVAEYTKRPQSQVTVTHPDQFRTVVPAAARHAAVVPPFASATSAADHEAGSGRVRPLIRGGGAPMQPLKQLGLTQLEQALPTLYETARQEHWTYETFFSRAIAAEIEGRDRRAAERRMTAARLPALKTLEAFDFRFQPTLSERLLWELADLSFLRTTTNVVFLGPPGVGKTHLSLALTVKARASGYSALFTTLTHLAEADVRALPIQG